MAAVAPLPTPIAVSTLKHYAQKSKSHVHVSVSESVNAVSFAHLPRPMTPVSEVGAFERKALRCCKIAVSITIVTCIGIIAYVAYKNNH